MEGDLPAVAAIVRIIQARCRLDGLIGKTPNASADDTTHGSALSPDEAS